MPEVDRRKKGDVDALEEQPEMETDEDRCVCDSDNNEPHQREEIEDRNGGRSPDDIDKPGFMEFLSERFPRIYHICMGVILPLLSLICLSLLFGYGLAKLEAPGEVESNDAFLRGLYEEYIEYSVVQQAVRETIQNVHPQCIQEFDKNVTYDALNASNLELFPFLETCYHQKAQEKYATLNAPDYYDGLVFLLDFNWLDCPRIKDKASGNDSGRLASYDQLQQTTYYVREFHSQFLKQSEEGEAMGMERNESISYGLEHASGGGECKPHIAAGALFWFTVMTTIGYGNTAPVTGGGRAMIFTIGFASIIAFTGLIGQAGYVILTIVDDAFQQHRRLKSLSRGLPSVLFWLAVLTAWMFFFAQIARVYQAKRYGSEDLDIFPFKDAIWFSYITMTTVGFGDYYVRHEEFVVGDMFFVPLFVLLGFVWLANFALKLSVYLMELFPEGRPLEDLLAKQRQK